MTIVCPQCGKDDSIQKVSAVYRDGYTITSYDEPVAVQTKSGTVYGSVKQSAASYTALARKLAPPEEPQPGSVRGKTNWGMVITGLIGLVIGMVVFGEKWSFAGMFLGFFAFVFAYYYLFVKPVDDKHKKLHPVWEKMMQKWVRLYYCGRDDCVFDPETNQSVPVDRMGRLLS